MSSGIAALIAHIGFWCLFAYGWMWDEIGLGSASLFLLFWIAGWLGLPYVFDGAALFSSTSRSSTSLLSS